ncbi:hypothetical protein [Burkholderia cepacia]|uniref:hypothetical protein n=1 Tax=Burkholderia cepacia TaxID=292 RepID=UPI00158A9C44|nr:hypothetical protein [Burkholderia cepacia]
MIKYKAINIREEWANQLNKCAEIFAISGSRMAQFALFYSYTIDSSKTQLRLKYIERKPSWVSIPFDDHLYTELNNRLKTDIKLSFADVLRRSIETLHNDLFNPAKADQVKKECLEYIKQK